jgi:hypothetical protein
VTYYVLFFIHLDTRRVSIAGIAEHPDSVWMEQMGRNATSEGWGFLQDRRYLLHDRDAKFSDSFRNTVRAGGVKPLKLPARSPNLNSFAERWVLPPRGRMSFLTTRHVRLDRWDPASTAGASFNDARLGRNADSCCEILGQYQKRFSKIHRAGVDPAAGRNRF